MLKEVYNPKAVIPHAASLHQACAHCAIFPTAASRRSLGRVSVPVWPVALSGRLPVLALVGHHPTNKLIGREPIPRQKNLSTQAYANPCEYRVLAPVSEGYPQAQGRLLTCYSPVRRSSTFEKAFPHDLHVLSTPPAFVLSQDQTLQQKPWQNKQSLPKNWHWHSPNTLLSSQRTTTHRGAHHICGVTLGVSIRTAAAAPVSLTARETLQGRLASAKSDHRDRGHTIGRPCTDRAVAQAKPLPAATTS
jgi:hypothetical protein